MFKQKNPSSLTDNHRHYEVNIDSLTFSIVKENNSFIHTTAAGNLYKKFNLIPCQIIGKELSAIFDKEVVEQKLPFFEKCWQGHDVNYQGEIGDFSYLVSLTPIKEKGKVIKIYGTVLDISVHKKNEAKLVNSEKLALVGQLAAGVAHEIRNPLTTLTGFTKMLLNKSSDAITSQYLIIMSSELDRISAIVNEYMDLARPNEKINIQLTDLKEIIQSVIHLVTTQAVLKNIQISFSVNPSIETSILCESNKIKQVLINIIQNAIDSMDKGIITIELEHCATDDMISIIIRDQGCGISKERKDHLFTPFYTTKEKGTGLGLMVSKSIIENHQGEIRVESVINKGTTVSILLPIK